MSEQRKAVIKNADMSEDMQQDAVDCASQALSKYNIEKVSSFQGKEEVLVLSCGDFDLIKRRMRKERKNNERELLSWEIRGVEMKKECFPFSFKCCSSNSFDLVCRISQLTSRKNLTKSTIQHGTSQLVETLEAMLHTVSFCLKIVFQCHYLLLTSSFNDNKKRRKILFTFTLDKLQYFYSRVDNFSLDQF